MPYSPITNISSFKEPEKTVPLWRYFDLPKFIYLLSSSSLYFPTLESLSKEDSGEGQLTLPQKKLVDTDFAGLTKVQKRLFNILSPEDLEVYSFTIPVTLKFNEIARRITYVNCWHQKKSESIDMWKLYSHPHGIAIKTSLKRIRDSLENTKHHIAIGRVQYLDYRFQKFDSSFPFMAAFYKQEGFMHENEIRLMYYEGARFQNWINKTLNGNGYTLKNKGGVQVPFDLNTLIDKIYTAPGTEKWIYNLMKSILKQYDINKPLIKSQMM